MILLDGWNYIHFTHHALKRARQKGLWSFVNKKKVYFDAKRNTLSTLRLENCIYVYEQDGLNIYIVTMYAFNA